jgi:hypothetical protein
MYLPINVKDLHSTVGRHRHLHQLGWHATTQLNSFNEAAHASDNNNIESFIALWCTGYTVVDSACRPIVLLHSLYFIGLLPAVEV